MNQSKKIALVSGSTQGIGLAIAKKLHEDGYLVIKNSRNPIDNPKVSDIDHMVADVSDNKECADLINQIESKYGRLDVLVSNVGSGKAANPDLSSEDYWKHYLSINFNAASFLIEAAQELLLQSQGNVVAISSICADNPRINAPIGYSTAKAALEMYIQNMAVKNGPQGVRFNVVSPGNVYFEGSVWDRKMQESKEEIEGYIRDFVPLGKFISPEDISEAVSFLVSDRAKNVTGMVLKVDGGQSL
jgi:3-oxoacyl-[acyl-carrier protein] reductase